MDTVSLLIILILQLLLLLLLTRLGEVKSPRRANERKFPQTTFSPIRPMMNGCVFVSRMFVNSSEISVNALANRIYNFSEATQL